MSRRRRRKARDRPVLARLGAHGTGDRFGPLAEAWRLDGPVAELVALYEATSPEAFQRVLVIPGRRTDTLPDDALCAFDRAHGDDATGVVESAVLATTNHRWTAITRALLERLTADVLHEGDANLLGMCFLEADTVSVTVPGTWLLDFYLQRRGDVLGRLDPAKTYSLPRTVSPQVRRWAAARAARDREGIARVLRRALRMDSRHGAAAILGLIDAAEHLDDADATEILELAADWPAWTVRLTALKHLAARGRHTEAFARAAGDRAATVRRWAARGRRAHLRTAQRAAPAAPAGSDEPPPAPPAAEPEQQVLFG